MANVASTYQAPIVNRPPGIVQFFEDDDECHQGLPDYPIELESRARDIEKLLMGNAVVGISGMGGIGKTTVAKRVYNDISKQFQYACFAENVKSIQLPDLEDWLLRHFHKRGTRMDGGRRRWADFKREKTLIVLDDVDSENQLSVLPKLHDFGKGSCIILTSREQDIFNFFDGYGLYQVQFLKDVEAKKLFCQHAFGIEDIPTYPPERNQLKGKVEAMVKKCSGLPLTVEVLGRYLRNETDPKVWKETIDKLRRAELINGKQKDRVWASLSVSYEALAKEEQNMFIEAGTYFFRRPLAEALAAWSSISGNSKTRWNNLVWRSMVKESQDKTVWVHEHLRDLSSTLTKGEIVSRAFGKADKSVDQLNSKQASAKTKILKLRNPSYDRILHLESLAELKELKYLDLDWIKTKGSGKSLPMTLSLLRWDGAIGLKSQFPITLIPMTNLAVLELRNWDVSKESQEALGNLTNLRRLSLSRLTGLDQLPKNFCNLSHLKYLVLNDLSLAALPMSFGNLSALEYLELRELDVSKLPESFGNLSSLAKLTIDSCEKLASLPSSFGDHLMSLKELNIRRCRILECLPDSFCLLSSLRQLSLEGCSALKELGDSFGSLSALEDLNLNSTGIERLPHSFSQLSGLRRLSLKFCNRLKELGDSFGNLSALKYLQLTCFGQLPESFGRLSALEDLACKFDQARSLPDNFCLLTSLRDLSIQSPSLESLPECLGDLAQLEKLHLVVDNVNALPASLGKLSSLQKLHIRSEKLGKLPESFAKLSSLNELRVWAKSSGGILTSIGPISSPLKILEVGDIAKSGKHMLDCDDSVELPDSFGKLSSLERLKIQSRSLESLPTSFGELSSLRDLDMECGNLKELPESLGMLSSLETLKIVARKLESLPQSIGQLHSLRTVKLEVASVRCLPESIEQLSMLRTFLFNCDGHDQMPDHFDRLPPLPLLSLVLEGKESVPRGIGMLFSVKDLTLQFPNVKSLPEELGELSSLQVLKIICPKLESLPDSLGRLSSLRELLLHNGYDLMSLPDSLGRLSSLRTLHLMSCERLKSLPDTLGRPSSSQVALPHGEGANAAGLTVIVESECEVLDKLLMRRLGWVAFEKGGRFMGTLYQRKAPAFVPRSRVIQSTQALCYIAISVYLFRKFYSAFQSKST